MFHGHTDIFIFSEISPDSFPGFSQSKRRSFGSSDKTPIKSGDKGSNKKPIKSGDKGSNKGSFNGKGDVKTSRERPSYTELSSSSTEHLSDDDRRNRTSRKHINGSQRPSGLRSGKAAEHNSPRTPSRTTRNSKSQVTFRLQFL